MKEGVYIVITYINYKKCIYSNLFFFFFRVDLHFVKERNTKLGVQNLRMICDKETWTLSSKSKPFIIYVIVKNEQSHSTETV